MLLICFKDDMQLLQNSFSSNVYMQKLLKSLENALDGDTVSNLAATLDDGLMFEARDPKNEHFSAQVTSEHIINGDIIYHLDIAGL